MDKDFIATTTFSFERFEIKKYLGIVRGLVVRTPTISQGFFGFLKSMAGGSNPQFAEMCEQARQEAYVAMVKHAIDRGANAVVGLRYDACEASGMGTEVLCYGTAVSVERIG